MADFCGDYNGMLRDRLLDNRLLELKSKSLFGGLGSGLGAGLSDKLMVSESDLSSTLEEAKKKTSIWEEIWKTGSNR